MDFVEAGGYMTLGSRLKRLGERLQADVHRLALAEGHDLPVGLLPMLGALDREGPCNVGELARALGIAQPGVTRGLGELVSRGLVESGETNTDRRVREVRLSSTGSALVEAMRPDLWRRVDRAVAEVCAGLGGPFLDQLAGLEAALDAAPLDARASRERLA